MTNLDLVLYGVGIVILAMIGYEAAARTNMRRLLRFGLPLYWRNMDVGGDFQLIDHLPTLYEKLSPEVDLPQKPGLMAQIFMQTAVPPILLLLPVTENELAFRRGYEQRGRLVYEPAKTRLRLAGFFTWPSLFMPVILLFMGLLFPISFLAVAGYIGMLLVGQRRIYRAMGAIIAHEFGSSG
jgi:hypothetical protein